MNCEGQETRREDTAQQMTSWELIYYVLRESFSQSVNESSTTGSLNISEPPNGESMATYDYGNATNHVRDLGCKVEVEYMKQDGKKDIVKLTWLYEEIIRAPLSVEIYFPALKGGMSAMLPGQA